MLLVSFWLLTMCLFVVKAMIECIIFDSDPSFNLFLDESKNEYHVYRLMELGMIFFLIVGNSILSVNFFYLLGMFIIGDFVFERTYNIYFKRWISPHPLKIYIWTINRKWWFPLIKLGIGIGLVCLFA